VRDLVVFLRTVTQLVRDVSQLVRTENEIKTRLLTEPKTDLGRSKR